MHPVLFEIFGIKVYGYGLMIALGIGAAVTVVTRLAKKRNYDEDSMFNLIIIAVLSGILGGKLLYIITDFKTLMSSTSFFRDFGNGFVIYGSIIGGGLGALFYSRRKQWRMLNILDMLAPGVILAQGFGRIGCFLAGCCYGKVTDLPIGVKFPQDSLCQVDANVIPTQLISSAFDFIVAFFLLWYIRTDRKEGRTFSLYVIIYSIGRFIIEFYRDDPRGSVWALSTSQFISVFTLILGIIVYNYDKIKPLIKKQ